MPFVPHTTEDITAMLASIGAESIEQLFDEIPAALKNSQLDKVPAGLSEMAVGRLMQERAEADGRFLSFIGAGAYEHHIPAAVWQITTRGEFYSAYTPYQAEASQGTLQLLYEFQTMMTSLTGMDVSNASLYDGASALAEAVLMAVRTHKRSRRILLPKTVHPIYRRVVASIVQSQNIELVELDYDAATGIVADTLASFEDFAALVIPQPNFFGCLEEVNALTDAAHAKKALVIAVVNPISLALLQAPGKWGSTGADIVVGEGQPLGCPLSSGGPYFGFMCCRETLVRQMPGRIIGRTEDLDGKPGFVLTLQAREQHIRRSKATSNICTNQGLLVTAATIYIALLGATGLKAVASDCHQKTGMLLEKLKTIDGVERVFSQPFFHEVVIRIKAPVAEVQRALTVHGILPGLDLSDYYPELGQTLLVCATETKTEADLENYRDHLARALSKYCIVPPRAKKS